MLSIIGAFGGEILENEFRKSLLFISCCNCSSVLSLDDDDGNDGNDESDNEGYVEFDRDDGNDGNDNAIEFDRDNDVGCPRWLKYDKFAGSGFNKLNYNTGLNFFGFFGDITEDDEDNEEDKVDGIDGMDGIDGVIGYCK